MSKSGKSFRESIRVHTRDYSLVVVAVMFVIFGLAISNNVIPNYHELQTLEHRHKRLQEDVEQAELDNDKLEDHIAALDDPYYIAKWMVENLHYEYAPTVVENPDNDLDTE